MSAENLLLKLRDALEVAGIPYMVTGSFVSAVHGVPRATHDIDVVIAPTSQQLLTLMKQFPESEYYAEIEDALQALRHTTQFNIIDERGVWKVDFIIRKDRPFSAAEFARRRVTKILGIPVYAVTDVPACADRAWRNGTLASGRLMRWRPAPPPWCKRQCGTLPHQPARDAGAPSVKQLERTFKHLSGLFDLSAIRVNIRIR